jgi:fido (protein-threonine AMPylation protein)
MSETPLSESIQHLNDALQTVPAEQAELRQRLEALRDELQQTLNDQHGDAEGLMERTQELMAEMDVEHPFTTRVLNQIMVTLSNIGI